MAQVTGGFYKQEARKLLGAPKCDLTVKSDQIRAISNTRELLSRFQQHAKGTHADLVPFVRATLSKVFEEGYSAEQDIRMSIINQAIDTVSVEKSIFTKVLLEYLVQQKQQEWPSDEEAHREMWEKFDYEEGRRFTPPVPDPTENERQEIETLTSFIELRADLPNKAIPDVATTLIMVKMKLCGTSARSIRKGTHETRKTRIDELLRLFPLQYWPVPMRNKCCDPTCHAESSHVHRTMMHEDMRRSRDRDPHTLAFRLYNGFSTVHRHISEMLGYRFEVTTTKLWRCQLSGCKYTADTEDEVLAHRHSPDFEKLLKLAGGFWAEVICEHRKHKQWHFVTEFFNIEENKPMTDAERIRFAQKIPSRVAWIQIPASYPDGQTDARTKGQNQLQHWPRSQVRNQLLVLKCWTGCL
jgi:hypothetical protein